ncbi:GNAT family N-acetyltransferase [Paenibacillus tuaregi]|uniref:GNAT family N-acetyltransferase n=1 Tax=Paenibacillus tuaregi TaxID=1816681 RepID=UPI0008391E19|nr:GNAT family N-acetyltransferase [Paenibacillus tuaregi]
MFELTCDTYYKVKPLLSDGFPHPEILSIIEGNNPGWIFTDDPDNPQSALVWSKGMQGFYLIGDHMNPGFIHALDQQISQVIFPRMREYGLSHFEVSGHHDNWNMEMIFNSRNLYKFEQMVFKLFRQPPEASIKQIRTINLRREPWENSDLQHVELVKENIGLFWSTYSDFTEKGYGFAALEGSAVTGMCYSSFVTGHTHAIGIEILPEFQNKGIGTHLAAYVVKELLEKGITPYWDCSLDNEASKRLAIRLGFEQVHQYKCFGFAID